MFLEGEEVSAITDRQWKYDLKKQLNDWTTVEKLIKAGKIEDDLTEIKRIKDLITEGIES